MCFELTPTSKFKISENLTTHLTLGRHTVIFPFLRETNKIKPYATSNFVGGSNNLFFGTKLSYFNG